MAVQLILPSDTLSAGFRVKANSNFNEIVVNSKLLKNNAGAYTGVLQLVKYNGGFINIDLSGIYYTQAQIGQLLSTLNSSPYSGAWTNINPYGALAVVDHEGKLWRSIINNNSDEPNTSGNWVDVLNETPSAQFVDFPVGSDLPLAINYVAYQGVFGPQSPTLSVEIVTQEATEDNFQTQITMSASYQVNYKRITGLLTNITVNADPQDDDDTKSAYHVIVWIK